MTTEILERLRAMSRRLKCTLLIDDRTALLQAEIAHQAAHFVEGFDSLDRALTEGGELPPCWRKQPTQEAGA